MKNCFCVLGMVVLSVVGISYVPASLSSELNVYSARQENLIKPLLDEFAKNNNVEVKLITGKADFLTKKISSEGKYTPADVLITTDSGRLHRAQALGLLQPIKSEFISKLLEQGKIDSFLIEPQNNWLGLTLRARTIIYNPEKIAESQLSTYEALAGTDFKNNICIRSSNNIYNQSLVSGMIFNLGKDKTQQWLNGLVKNFARSPQGGDRDQIAAVAVGKCAVGVVNTYYLAGMLASSDEKKVELAKKVKVFWPNQSARGVHVNISGIAITKYAKNVDNANKLVGFMLSKNSQKWYAQTNHEYPVRKDVATSQLLNGFGKFKADNQSMANYGILNKEAVMLMDRAGWK